MGKSLHNIMCVDCISLKQPILRSTGLLAGNVPQLLCDRSVLILYSAHIKETS